MNSLEALRLLYEVGYKGKRVTEYDLKTAYRIVVIAESASRSEASDTLGVSRCTIARVSNDRKPWMVLPGAWSMTRKKDHD